MAYEILSKRPQLHVLLFRQLGRDEVQKELAKLSGVLLVRLVQPQCLNQPRRIDIRLRGVLKRGEYECEVKQR